MTVAADIRPGAAIKAGHLLGEIGNHGTDTASAHGSDASSNPSSIHLHWELYVDDVFLGASLGASQTRDIYTKLLAK